MDQSSGFDHHVRILGFMPDARHISICFFQPLHHEHAGTRCVADSPRAAVSASGLARELMFHLQPEENVPAWQAMERVCVLFATD